MRFNSKKPKILVVGSCSIDLVLNTEKHPDPNETVMAYKSEHFFGGKGANQAVGCARLGAEVALVGCIGKDGQGGQILRNLSKEGVNISRMVEAEDGDTGSAYVVAAEGKNAIVVIPAANNKLSPADVDLAEDLVKDANLVLLQLEIPMAVVNHTISLCKKHHVKVGIYAAPAFELAKEVIDYASFIVVKSVDIEKVFAGESADGINKKYPNKLFIRDDSNSTTFFTGEEMKYFRNDPSEVLHKMGMGDAFTSGFAIAFCHGNTTEECVKFGNRVSMKVASNRGSQGGLPFLSDLTF